MRSLSSTSHRRWHSPASRSVTTIRASTLPIPVGRWDCLQEHWSCPHRTPAGGAFLWLIRLSVMTSTALTLTKSDQCPTDRDLQRSHVADAFVHTSHAEARSSELSSLLKHRWGFTVHQMSSSYARRATERVASIGCGRLEMWPRAFGPENLISPPFDCHVKSFAWRSS